MESRETENNNKEVYKEDGVVNSVSMLQVKFIIPSFLLTTVTTINLH